MGDGPVRKKIAASVWTLWIGLVAVISAWFPNTAHADHPTVTTVSVPPDATYVTGSQLEFWVYFDQPVTVDGAPRLELKIGSETVYADFVMSDSNEMLFRYVVKAGDLDEDGIEVSALDLNGGTISNGSGNADLTLNSIASTTGVLVDGAAPRVIDVTSSKANGAYGAGTVIPIEVTFNEPVFVTGTPQLTLETGDVDRTAEYKSVNGATLWFEYTVQAGDASSDLDYASAAALVLTGGATIKDKWGNPADLTLPDPGGAGSLGANKAIVIDTTAPKIASVEVPAAGSYKSGTNLTFAVHVDEPVAVDTSGGKPRIKLTIGISDRYAEYTPTGSTDTKLNFVYTVAPGNTDDDGIEVASFVETNGGTIRDAAGNNLELSFDPVNTSGIKVDTALPQVSSVSVPANGSYAAGDVLEFVVKMNEPVTVTGTPLLNLVIGSVLKAAAYIETVNDSELKFRYTVVPGEWDDDGITVSSLSLPAGAGIADAAGNPAIMVLNNVGNTAGVLVDGVAPQVTGVSVPAAGTYALGQTLSFTVFFDETVVVQTAGGTPVLPLEIGAASADAAYVSGTGTNAITFEYVVKLGDADADGIKVGSEIKLSGGSMTDAAGNGVLLQQRNVDDTAGILVDAGVDAVEAVAALSAPEAGASNTVTLTVKDSQGNTVTAFSGEHDVTVSGHEAAPDQSYGSIDGTPLAGGAVKVTVVFTNGMATVNLKLNKADAQTITFAVAGINTPDTVDIAPAAGPAVSMKLTADIASPVVNGGTFATQPAVTLVDAFGNVRVHDDATVVTAVKHDAGSWNLTGTTSGQAQAGVVTFTDLGATNPAAVAGAQIAFEAAGLQTVLSSAVSLPWPSLEAPVIGTVTPGDGQIRIEWAPVYGATGFRVYVSEVSGSYGSETDSVDGEVHEYTVTGLTNGTMYYVVVKAVNPGGVSPDSNEMSATPQGDPDGGQPGGGQPGGGQPDSGQPDGGQPGGGQPDSGQPGGGQPDSDQPGGGQPDSDQPGGGQPGGGQPDSDQPDSGQPDSDQPGGGQPDSVQPDSGQNSAPSQPENPQPAGVSVDVLVNGKAEAAGTMTTGTRNGRNTVTVTLDLTRMEDRFAGEGQGAVVTVPVSIGTEVVIGELNGRMVKVMEIGDGALELRTTLASYMLPARQINIDAVSAQFGEEVALRDIMVQIEIAEPEEETVRVAESAAADGSFALVAPPVVFTVRAVHGDTVIEIAKFTAYVERTIALPDDADPGRITTGVAVEPDGTVRHVPTRVSVIDGKYYAVINSLTNSTYTVIWHPVAFRDMAGHWAEEAVNDMGSRLVFEGIGGENFAPDLPITRAEFAAILVRALGLSPEQDGTVPFADIRSGDWYAGFVRTAQDFGLLQGHDDGTFRPTERITREQAMVAVSRAMALTGRMADIPTADAEQELASFNDAADVSKWARSGVAATIKAGMVSGRDGGRIAPGDTISRAEVAVLVRRLLQKSGLI